MHPGRSGRNHLRALADFAGLPASRVDEVLALVEMSDAADRRAGGYSTGMRQRLGPRRHAARRPRGARPRRAGQRPGPAGHPLAARLPARRRRARAARCWSRATCSPRSSRPSTTSSSSIAAAWSRAARSPVSSRRRASGCARPRRPSSPPRWSATGPRSGADGTLLVVPGRTTDEVGELAFAIGAPVHELAVEAASLEEVFFHLTSDQEASDAGVSRLVRGELLKLRTTRTALGLHRRGRGPDAGHRPAHHPRRRPEDDRRQAQRPGRRQQHLRAAAGLRRRRRGRGVPPPDARARAARRARARPPARRARHRLRRSPGSSSASS